MPAPVMMPLSSNRAVWLVVLTDVIRRRCHNITSSMQIDNALFIRRQRIVYLLSLISVKNE